MWAAIRYRKVQALVLVILSALITSCAVLAPLYSRALEQALLRNAVFRANPADTALSLSLIRSAISPDATLDTLREAVPGKVQRFFQPGIGSYTGQGEVVPRAGLKVSPLRLIARDRQCEHLRFVAGRCPTAAAEVAVSAADHTLWKWRVGQSFEVSDSAAPGATAPYRMTIVGVYQQVPDDGYWLRTLLGGKSGTTTGDGLESVPALDDWVTSAATFTQPQGADASGGAVSSGGAAADPAWPVASLLMQYPVNRERLALDELPRTAAAVQRISVGANGVSVINPMSRLVRQVQSGRSQVRLIVPLLMAQLGLLAAAVLLSVAGAAVEQRRPEVALARLRGRSRDGARRLVLGELGVTVLLGLPLGFGLALAVGELARRLVLPPGVPFELRWPLLVALGVAALVCLVSVAIAVQPVKREPISALLRRVAATRGRGGWSMTDVILVTLAVAGIVGLATGTMTGPLALLTPTVVSLAVGLLLARVLALLAAGAGQRRLDRGRVAAALAAFQLARRPALRKVLTIVTVATALIVFAGNAVVVADRNRQQRAELETGAPAVLVTDSDQPAKVAAAAHRIDPAGRDVTPVAIIQPQDAASSPTIAVEPRSFETVSYPPPNQPPLDLGRIAPPALQPLRLDGTTLTAEVSSTLRFAMPPDSSAPAGSPPLPPGSVPVPTQLLLSISVTMPDGSALDRDLGTVPMAGRPAVRISAPLLCPQGCRLDAIQFRVADLDTGQMNGTITIKDLALDGAPLHVGDLARWQRSAPGPQGVPDTMTVAAGSSPDNLLLDVVTTGNLLRVAYADVPARLPALLAGPVPPGGTADQFQGSGLNGTPTTMRAVQTVPALPAVLGHGMLVNYDTLGRLGGRAPGGASLQLWVGDAAPPALARVRAGLAEQGISVLTTRTYAHAKQGYDRSAAGWGLQLALVTGVMALVIAALVLVVVAVAGWRLMVRDFATLRMAGVRLAALRSAARLEQLVVVAVAVLAGAVSGVVGSALAMPLVPLFDVPAAVPAPDLAPAWGVIAAAVLAALAALAAVALAVATALGKRFSLARIREAL